MKNLERPQKATQSAEEIEADLDASVATIGHAAITRALEDIAEETGGSYEVPLGGGLSPCGELPKATIAAIIRLFQTENGAKSQVNGHVSNTSGNDHDAKNGELGAVGGA